MVRTVIQPVVRLFSSVWFGILLLALLFLYMSVGSAGIVYPVHPNLFHPDAWVHAQMRQWRPFEMTEFEWFHWWPFETLMALLTVTLVVTTIRRIPLKVVNLGVWMIHTGVVTLILGSLIYFGTKIEGEATVARRAVKITLAETPAVGQVLAMPGNRTTVGSGDSKYDIEVRSIDPAWELLSGPDKGQRAYSVNLMVQGKGQRFIRQVIAGYPQYTEDLIFTQDKAQPMKRAVKETGKPLVDEGLQIELVYESQPWFYLKNDLNKSWALYLRRPGETEWVERPIDGLPLYNDCIASTNDVFGAQDSGLTPHPIRVAVPAVAPNDPAPGVTFQATGYLRYAQLKARWAEGAPTDPVNPVVFVSAVGRDGRRGDYRLAARVPDQRSADEGLIALREISEEAQLAPMTHEPALVLRVPALGVEIREPIRDVVAADANTPFRPIGAADSGYSYRVASVQDDLPIAGREVSVAIIEMRTPKGEFRRWVFSDPALTRDLAPGQTPAQAMAHTGQSWVDETVTALYQPGNGLALVLFVAGPEPGRLRLVDGLQRNEPRVLDIEQGRPVELGLPSNAGEQGGDASGAVKLIVTAWMPRAVQEQKPYPVPPEQRTRDARELFSMVQVTPPAAEPEWLKYHPYVFTKQEEVLRRYWLDPSVLTLADGSQLEVMFSRQRMLLPTPVALEEFVLDTNVGGFSGATSSIRNYTSIVRFAQPNGDWGAPLRLSVNEPVEHEGYWFFQSQWDPPEESRQGGLASAGLNYTVLGVGNRNGVQIQLIGCILAVLGMAYAFYAKPVIKRRQKQLVLQEIAAAKKEGRAPAFGSHQKETTHV